jgi:uncharacterized protein YeaO (DUF488 family)
MLLLKRVYDPPSQRDGVRFLVERLWPRGVRKQDLSVDGWQKDVGPSDRLRKWFGHDPARWDKFREKYFSELDARPEAWEPIRKSAEHQTVTLVYSSRDTEHNNAVALKQYLEQRMAQSRRRTNHGKIEPTRQA